MKQEIIDLLYKAVWSRDGAYEKIKKLINESDQTGINYDEIIQYVITKPILDSCDGRMLYDLTIYLINNEKFHSENNEGLTKFINLLKKGISNDMDLALRKDNFAIYGAILLLRRHIKLDCVSKILDERLIKRVVDNLVELIKLERKIPWLYFSLGIAYETNALSLKLGWQSSGHVVASNFYKQEMALDATEVTQRATELENITKRTLDKEYVEKQRQIEEAEKQRKIEEIRIREEKRREARAKKISRVPSPPKKENLDNRQKGEEIRQPLEGNNSVPEGNTNPFPRKSEEQESKASYKTNHSIYRIKEKINLIDLSDDQNGKTLRKPLISASSITGLDSNLSPSEMMKQLKVLLNNTNVKIFKLVDVGLTDEMLALILTMRLHHGRIDELDVSNNSLTNASANCLIGFLRQGDCITKIRLDGTHISSQHLMDLFFFASYVGVKEISLLNNASLKTINWSRFGVTDGMLALLLTKHSKSISIDELNLSFNPLTDISIVQLTEFLRRGNKIAKIHLDRTLITGQHLMSLLFAARLAGVKEISFLGNKLVDPLIWKRIEIFKTHNPNIIVNWDDQKKFNEINFKIKTKPKLSKEIWNPSLIATGFKEVKDERGRYIGFAECYQLETGFFNNPTHPTKKPQEFAVVACVPNFIGHVKKLTQ